MSSILTTSQGDSVIVTEGELKNLQGVVYDVSKDGENIMINANGIDEQGKKVGIGNLPVLRSQLKSASFFLFLFSLPHFLTGSFSVLATTSRS